MAAIYQSLKPCFPVFPVFVVLFRRIETNICGLCIHGVYMQLQWSQCSYCQKPALPKLLVCIFLKAVK